MSRRASPCAPCWLARDRDSRPETGTSRIGILPFLSAYLIHRIAPLRGIQFPALLCRGVAGQVGNILARLSGKLYDNYPQTYQGANIPRSAFLTASSVRKAETAPANQAGQQGKSHVILILQKRRYVPVGTVPPFLFRRKSLIADMGEQQVSHDQGQYDIETLRDQKTP